MAGGERQLGGHEDPVSVARVLRCDAADTASAPLVVLMNERLASYLSQFGPPLGQTLTFDVADSPIVMRVVGIVGDIRHQHLGIAPTPEVYASFEQGPQQRYSLVMQTNRPDVDVSGF